MPVGLPPWLSPDAALGWGALASQAARARQSADLERAQMAQRASEFAIESQQRSQQAAQSAQAQHEALDYNHQVEQQKIAIDQAYKTQTLALDAQAGDLAQKQFDAKTAQAAKSFSADQQFQKSMLPKEQGGEGLDPVHAALKYKSGTMTATELGRLSTMTAPGFQMGAPSDIPGLPGKKAVETSKGHYQIVQAPSAATNAPPAMEVTNPKGDVIGYEITLPNGMTHYQPKGQTKPLTPMEALRQKQAGGATAPKSEYKSKEDVVKAFKDGKLTREEAAKTLNADFGVPLK